MKNRIDTREVSFIFSNLKPQCSSRHFSKRFHVGAEGAEQKSPWQFLLSNSRDFFDRFDYLLRLILHW